MPSVPTSRRRGPRRVSPNALHLPDHRAAAAAASCEFSRTVIDRAAALAAEDRALLRAFLEDGATCTDLARIAGITRGRMRRRLAGLISRVMSEEFRFVRSRLEGPGGSASSEAVEPWGQIRRAVATVHFINGRPIRETAAVLGISVHRVRTHIDQIRVEFELATRAAERRTS